jgi:hypothetical protein
VVVTWTHTHTHTHTNTHTNTNILKAVNACGEFDNDAHEFSFEVCNVFSKLNSALINLLITKLNPVLITKLSAHH